MLETSYLNGLPVLNDSISNYLPLGEIDLTKKNYRDSLEMILCRPDGTEISVLHDSYNIKITTIFKDIDELEFNLPYYVTQQYKQMKNPNWDLLKNDYLIKVNNEKMFIVNTIDEESNNSAEIKNVHCYSREYQLSKRNLRNFNGTRQLYKDNLDGSIVSVNYSFDNIIYQQYTTPFTIGYGKDIYIRLYDINSTLINQYLWNSNNPLIQTKGISVTYSQTDFINNVIQVSIKNIAETGDGILNILEQETTWKVGFLDPLIREDTSLGQNHRTYRTFSISEKSWSDFLKTEIQQSFNCVVTYDTINKLVNIYSLETLTQNKGLYITEENYIKTIKRNTKHDGLITRLEVYGNNNLGISSVNPTGMPYIENYSFYRNVDYMSQTMLDKMIAYDNLITTETPIFYTYLSDLVSLENNTTILNSQLVDLKSSYQIEYDKIDLAAQVQSTQNNTTVTSNFDTNGNLVATINSNITSSTIDCTAIQAVLNSIQAQINSKNIEIANNQTAIQNKLQQITDLKNVLDKTTGTIQFTATELGILDTLTSQKTWSNANYSDAKELMSAGMDALDSLSKPIIEFTLGVVDLLNVVSCQHDWNKINIGDEINIYYSNFNISIVARIVKIEHQVDSDKGDTLALTISTNDDVQNPAKYLSSIASSLGSVSATVDMGQSTWNLSSSTQDTVSNILNNAWDSSKSAVLSGRNQNISIDERGISLKNLVNDGRQIRMINNVIAFTKDNWDTVGTAITADGICAPALYGKIIGSNKLIITNMNDSGQSSFLVDGNHMQAVNMDLALENAIHTNRIYMNPDQGFKIQKKNGSSWDNQLWLDTSGNVYAKSFHIINNHSVLDDNGLVIDNGYIKVNNQYGDNVFNVDTNGDVNAIGRFQVIRYNGSSKVILADLYKDERKGGKLEINNWNGQINSFIGSPLDPTKYSGGSIKLYNDDINKERVEISILSRDDAGSINLKDTTSSTKVHLSAKDGANNHGVISLFGEDQNSKLVLKARSDTDNMSGIISGDRQTGGYIEFTSYDNSTNYFITANNENNFGMYDNARSAFEINHSADSVIVSHKATETLTLSNNNIMMGFINSSGYDTTKPYLNITNSGITLGMGNNTIQVTSSGIKLNGTRIDLN